MGSSAVTFREGVLFDKDGVVEVWFSVLLDSLDKSSNLPEWVDMLQKQWREQVWLAINGCISPKLEEFLTDEARIHFVCNFADAAIVWLRKQGPELSKDVLNELITRVTREKYDSYFGSNPTEKYILYGEAFIQLLRGEIKGHWYPESWNMPKNQSRDADAKE